MPIIIEASPGAVDANSYVDLQFAQNLINSSVGRSLWPADEELQKASLIEATRLIDSLWDWYFKPASDTQALDWPMENAEDKFGRPIRADEIPKDLKYVTVDLAYHLIVNEGLSTPADFASSVRVGPIAVTLDANKMAEVFDRKLIARLSHFGDYIVPRGNTIQTASVVRT